VLVHVLVLVVVGFLSGGVNAVAGGGSLLVFPALLATGLAPLPATVTNSVSQTPGYFGSIAGQRADLAGQPRRLALAAVATALGTVIGCALLLVLPGQVFAEVVPALLVVAAVLTAAQPWIQRRLHRANSENTDRMGLLLSGTFLVSIYGGYFGGARGVVLLAWFLLASADSPRRLNALKNGMAGVDSLVTLVIYALLAPVHWLSVLTLAPSTVLGGYVGGRLARHLPTRVLRWVVVVVALGVAAWMLLD
jgi:uncharacterized membrane protein YfcA